MYVLFWVVSVILVFGFTTAFMNSIVKNTEEGHDYLVKGCIIFGLFVFLIIVFKSLEVI